MASDETIDFSDESDLSDLEGTSTRDPEVTLHKQPPPELKSNELKIHDLVACVLYDWSCVSAGCKRNLPLSVGKSAKESLDEAGIPDAPKDPVHAQKQPPASEATETLVQWPLGDVPPEIFQMMSGYLSYEDFKSLRLVCREFEEKLPNFFRSVVVPFSTSAYNAERLNFGLPENGNLSALDQKATSNTDAEDLKTFEERAWSIRKFAFAFECHEELLSMPLAVIANPCWLSNQTFYGEFAWPQDSGVTFNHIKQLESMAGQHKHMQAALRYLTGTSELGLCVDNGLGWLNVPESSHTAVATPVFRQLRSGTAQPARPSRTWDAFREHVGEIVLDQQLELLDSYARILKLYEEASPSDLQLAVEYMARNPLGKLSNTDSASRQDNVKSFIDDYGRFGFPVYSNRAFDVTVEELIDLARKGLVEESTCIPGSRNDGRPPMASDDYWAYLLKARLLFKNARDAFFSSEASPSGPFLNWGTDSPLQLEVTPSPESHCKPSILPHRPFQISVRPAHLSPLQLMLLKEIRWAQTEFLSTFMLGVIDNKMALSNVTTLNLAKLPSSYLRLLDREDFWQSLAKVTKLRLMVSPDWRSIPSDSCEATDSQSPAERLPVLATSQFLQILKKHVQDNPCIKDLCLGYVGSGEHAVGLLARNQNVLPAPIVGSSPEKSFCLLPFVESLTLVNCWAVPCVLREFVEKMQELSLANLELDSFSLVAFGGHTLSISSVRRLPQNILPLNPNHPTQTLQQQLTGLHQAIHMNALTPWQMMNFLTTGFPGGPPQHHTLPNAPAAADTTTTLIGFGVPEAPAQAVYVTWGRDNGFCDRVASPVRGEDVFKARPVADTWGEVINAITPETTLEEEAYKRGVGPRRPAPPPIRDLGSFRRLELKSCGYVKLPFQNLMAEFDVEQDMSTDQRVAAVQSGSMLNSDNKFLGHIIPKTMECERTLLTEGFRLRLGWGDVDRRFEVLRGAQREGGLGRYSGVIEKVEGRDWSFGIPDTLTTQRMDQEDP